MHLRKWMRSKRPSRKGSSTQQSARQNGKVDDPPPYPHGPLAINDAMAEYIEHFLSTIRPRPGRDWQLEMLMFPTTAYLSDNVFGNQGWVACVSVSVKNLPSLMRSGFHVTEENMRREKSHFVLDPRVQNLFEDQPTHFRNYALESTGNPVWNAKVVLAASTVRELSQFRMAHGLSGENVGAAVGFNRSGKRVYSFSALNPNENFNAVYDDMPLDGWWPWPRGDLQSSKKFRQTGGLLERMRKGWNKLW